MAFPHQNPAIQTLIEPQAVARIDRAMMESGIAGYDLMTRAGLAVSRLATERYPQTLRHVVLCGPGNNGGDGYIAAADLRASGLPVSIFALNGQLPKSEDARRAARACSVSVSDLGSYKPEAGDLIIDAVFGAGLDRDVPAQLADVAALISASGTPVIAVDMPSGICGHAGRVLGAAIRADVTVTFMAMKPGQLLEPGRQYCGEIIVADIGVPHRLILCERAAVTPNHPDLWRNDILNGDPAAHKYFHGHLLVLSGDPLHTGASRLSATAALRSGAGLVTVAGARDALFIQANHLTAIMLKAVDDLEGLSGILSDPRINAGVLGPAFGIGQKARDYALAFADRRLVVDADGITSFQGDPESLFAAFRNDAEPRLVLTPHEGEFARLFPDIAKNEDLSKVDRALQASSRSGAIILLKGADTVIAAPDGRAVINGNAPAWLATAGSGDVLAGIIGGLIANHIPLFEAACAAAWLHGRAGTIVGKSLTAESLVEAIGPALMAMEGLHA